MYCFFMNGKKLWIQFWDNRIKQSKKNNCVKGLSFLNSYTMKDASLVFSELLKGLEMTTAGRFNSGYKVVMPGSENIYQRIRIANHPYSINEWTKHEIDGLPNVRYSIFIYNPENCPQFAKLSQTKWRAEYSEGVPIYEKGFNEKYLHQLFPKLINILKTIYSGGSLEPQSLPLKINEECKTNKNMAKNKIRITENELKQIVSESVKKVLNETYKQGVVDKAIQSLLRLNH